MKKILLPLLFFMGPILNAQNFSEVMDDPFEDISRSTADFVDVDGDNDLDLLLTGVSFTGRIAKLYINDGAANFTEQEGTPFAGVSQADVAFADIDGDNDQDVLIVGWLGTSDTAYSAELYKNDGAGNFSLVEGTSFTPVVGGAVDFADIDQDGDQDVLIVGPNVNNNRVADLYINDGTGNFTEQEASPFLGTSKAASAFADIDNDGDQDVLITGTDFFSGPSSRLYVNDGFGNFSLQTSLFGIGWGSVEFADIDGDDDKDLLITGQNNGLEDPYVAKLYKNNGAGIFTEMTNTPFTGVRLSSVAFADIDGDNDLDIYVTGIRDLLDDPIGRLYVNDGLGNYVERTQLLFEETFEGTVNFADLNGSGSEDLLITGFIPVTTGLVTGTTKLYLNNSITTVDFLNDKAISSLDLFPNPASRHLNVKINAQDNQLMEMSIFDTNGRLVSRQDQNIQAGQNNFSIDIAHLTKGLYIIQLNNGSSILSRKFSVL